MFLKLTFYDGSTIAINFALVEAMQPTDENKANTAICTVSGSYQVRETMEEIFNLLSPPPFKNIAEDNWR